MDTKSLCSAVVFIFSCVSPFKTSFEDLCIGFIHIFVKLHEDSKKLCEDSQFPCF